MGEDEISQFLTDLAVRGRVSASTQNQAFSAILFLYRHVLHIELDEPQLAKLRPQRSKPIPTVLSKDEVKRIIANLADDLRHLQRSEIAEVREEFAEGQVGSSTMPQKRNPWNAEHVKSLWKAFAPRVTARSATWSLMS